MYLLRPIHAARAESYDRIDDLMPAAEPTGEDAGDLLTSEQVMDCLLAHAKLRRLASTCVLPGVKVGAEWRFRRSDLEAWIEMQTALPPRTASESNEF